MLRTLALPELLNIFGIVKAAVADRHNPAMVIEQVMAMHRLNNQLVIQGKTRDQDLVTALLIILEHEDCYGLAQHPPTLVSNVIKRFFGDGLALSPLDFGKKLEIDLGM